MLAPAFGWLFAIVGGLSVCACGHRDHDVFALFAVGFIDAQLQVVLLDAELSFFAERQKDGVFVVFGTDAVDDTVGLQGIFLAEQGARFAVGVVGADDLAGDALVTFLIAAAGHGFHLKDGAGLGRLMIAGIGEGCAKQGENHDSFHRSP